MNRIKFYTRVVCSDIKWIDKTSQEILYAKYKTDSTSAVSKVPRLVYAKYTKYIDDTLHVQNMVFGSHSHLWLSPPRYFLSRSFASALSGYGAFAICSCIDLCYYFIIFWQRNVTKGKMFIWFFIETWISQDPNPSQIYKFMQKVEMTSQPLENLF